MRVLGLVALLYAIGQAFPSGAEAPPDDRLTRQTRDGLDKRRPSWAPDGKHLAYAPQESDGIHLWQYVWEPGTTNPPRRLLPDHEPPHFDATFSPDGARLLVSVI